MPRPLIVGVVAMSLDGKIATRDRDDHTFSSKRDRLHLNTLRAEAGALVVGAGTIRASDTPMRVWPRKLLAGRPEPIRVVVSRLCLLASDLKVFKGPAQTVVFTSPDSSPGARKALSGVADLRISAGSSVTASEIVLGLPGVKRFQVEGGGELMWTFLSEGFLDELHVTVCPVAIGGNTAPTSIGGEGFEVGALRDAKLLDCRKEGDEVYLHYRLKPRI